MNDELLKKKLIHYLRTEGDEYDFDRLFHKIHDREFLERMQRNADNKEQKSIE